MAILLVEDDEDHVFLLRRAFNKWGNLEEVCIVRTLKEARRSLEAFTPQLVITDLKLPDGRGDALLDGPSPLEFPVVVMTCQGDEQAAVQVLKLGAMDYVVKSVEVLGRMPEIAEEAIHLWQERRRALIDVEELRLANDRLKALVTRDALTELFNRRGLQEELLRLSRQSWEQEAQHVVALVDCDNFKEINTLYGHAAGDQVLKTLAERMRQALRVSDIVARVGGDEFILVLPFTALGAGLKLADRLRATVSNAPINADQAEILLSVSLGVSTFQSENSSIDELLRVTRAALGLSKTYGKNRVATADGKVVGMGEDWTENLDQALCDPNRIGTRAQPIMDLHAQSVVGYEIFSRGTIKPLECPMDFFRVAEERALLSQVDINCLHACLEVAPNLLEAKGTRIHLNIFPSTILGLDLGELAGILRAYMPLERLCLELNMQYVVGDPGMLRDRVRELQQLGVSIALDDVGFGRSCLETLIVLEPNAIKIDRVLVDGVSENEGRRRALGRLIQVARCLGADIYAEGVECRNDLGVLTDFGVQYAQGYLWGAPLGVSNIVEANRRLIC